MSSEISIGRSSNSVFRLATLRYQLPVSRRTSYGTDHEPSGTVLNVHCASFCSLSVVLLMSFAMPPAIRPNSLLVPLPLAPLGVLRPFSLGNKGCLASDLPLPETNDVEDEEEGRAERDLMDASVEWNSDVRSLGAILPDLANATKISSEV